jgi:hypothetical protein
VKNQFLTLKPLTFPSVIAVSLGVSSDLRLAGDGERSSVQGDAHGGTGMEPPALLIEYVQMRVQGIDLKEEKQSAQLRISVEGMDKIPALVFISQHMDTSDGRTRF